METVGAAYAGASQSSPNKELIKSDVAILVFCIFSPSKSVCFNLGKYSESSDY